MANRPLACLTSVVPLLVVMGSVLCVLNAGYLPVAAAECPPFDTGDPRPLSDPLCTGAEEPLPEPVVLPGTLTTFFAFNNFGNLGGGIYFDLENVSGNPIEITHWDVNMCAFESLFDCTPGGSVDVNVWFRPGTSQGFEQTTNGWQLMGTAAGSASQGPDQPTRINVGGLVILPGETYGIAMSGAQWFYTNGNGANEVHNNGEIELRAGSANNVAFVSGAFSPRVWNGTVFYVVRVIAPAPMLSKGGLVVVVAVLLIIGAVVLHRRIINP